MRHVHQQLIIDTHCGDDVLFLAQNNHISISHRAYYWSSHFHLVKFNYFVLYLQDTNCFSTFYSLK